MSEWKEVQLGDLIEIKYGKDHKKLNKGNIPCFGSGGIMRYVDEQLYDKESILIPRKGSLNNILFQNSPFWTVDTMFWSKIDIQKAYPKFLYYQLTLIDYTVLNVGSAVPSLTVPVINTILINLPSLSEQKEIAEVLSSLDDKIDLLNRQNKTLEQIAETLFRQWFVEEAQDDWEVKELKECVNTIDNRGKTPPNFSNKSAYPVIEVNALGQNNRFVDYSVIKKYVTKETFYNFFRDKLEKFDTLLATVGSIGKISMYVLEIGNVAQNVIGLRAENISKFYVYQFLKFRINEILSLDIGGVQPSIKVPHLLSIQICIPPKDLQVGFDNQVKNIVQKMENNQKQIYTLKNMRDTLLPKLMNGEISVKN